MIYFRPLGGLCNRLRAIDSILTLAHKHQKKVVIIWVNNDKLNCSSNGLFEMTQKDNVEILEFNNGKELEKLNEMEYVSDLNSEVERFQYVFGNKDLGSTLFNRQLSSIYDSKSYRNTKTLSQIDEKFFKNVETALEELISTNENVYISSCYRLVKMEDNYDRFKFNGEIKQKVAEITKEFNNTIGLHIRRSDHFTAKKYSSLELYLKIISEEIRKNSDATFFLATDCSETKNLIISKFKHKIKFNNITSYERSNDGAIKSALVDLLCLSKTKLIYGSHHSTFSQVAADIGGIKSFSVKKNNLILYLKEFVLNNIPLK